MASSPSLHGKQRGEKVEAVRNFIFLGSKITVDDDLLFGRKAMANLDSILKSRDINFADKGPSSQSYGFSSSHVWMWEEKGTTEDEMVGVMLTPWKKSHDQPRQHIKKQRHNFANKGPSSQGCGFSSSDVWIWELDYKEN